MSLRIEQVLAMPPTIDVPTAGAVLGMNRDKAYKLVRDGEFPLPILRVGKRLRVSTDALLKYLGVEPDHSRDTHAPTSDEEATFSRAVRRELDFRPRAKNGKPIDPEKVYYVRAIDEFFTGAEILRRLAR
ncbi:hypothetical protein GCM10022380_54450 [Amycolatopsis tucumanensis]|uniref:Helix-turn-helix domain-containing protein n=2 Tax=Amycolatopsis tucumanensis TaxID=401106 RepID=A0ABP7IWQ0_9PSEU